MPEPQFPAMLGLFNVILLMRLAHDAIPVIWTYYTMLKLTGARRKSVIPLWCEGDHRALSAQPGTILRPSVPRQTAPFG
jgi:hypothetical protein